MHELSVASAIVDTVVRHAEGNRVEVVSLRLGRLRQVVPDSLGFYFGIAGRDTVCEGASLEIESIDVLMSCGACGNEWDPQPPAEHGEADGGGYVMPQFRCPRCESAGARVVRGDELEVESIEVRTADEEPVPATKAE